MSLYDEKPVVKKAGSGGLGSVDGAPIREPEEPRYRPEASFTGDVRGPIVPSNLPEGEILDRIEKGGGMPNIESGRWWQPHMAPPSWPEIDAKLTEDPNAKAFFSKLRDTQTRVGLTSFNDRHLYAEYTRLLKHYEAVLNDRPFAASPTAAFVCYYGIPDLVGI